jgi:SAM-dependent methyltransferase
MDLKIEQLNVLPAKPDSFFDLLDYQLFSHNSYEKYEINALTKEDLKKLADFSETIEKPYLLGKFNSEQHYLNTLSLVLSSTDETRNRISFFLNKILPELPVDGSLLDVGPGDGSLTKSIAQKFKDITLVDINLKALNDLQKLLPTSISIEQISKSILNVELPSDTHHLAVLSHMLYYIDPKSWLEIIKSVYRSLTKNGTLVIIMGGDELDKSELIKHFGGMSLGIDQLATECRNTFGADNVNLYASNESFVSCSQEAMLHISAFMLADANILASKDDLTKYINQKFKKSDSHFEMTTKQKYIIIKKNGHLRDERHDCETVFTVN